MNYSPLFQGWAFKIPDVSSPPMHHYSLTSTVQDTIVLHMIITIEVVFLSH